MAATYFLAISVSNGGPVVAPGALAGPALPAGLGLGVQAFSWGVSVPVQFAPGSGLSVARASFSDLSIVTRVGASSPRLLVLAASGNALAQVQLIVFQTAGAGLRETERYVLQGAIVSSVQSSGSQGEEFASQAMSFAYRSVKHSVYAYDGANRATLVGDGGWDLVTNRGM